MAKKSKVLKQRKAPKDFQKDKRKVGKGKKAAQNDTKTDYKVKQISLLAQNALDEKGEEVTKRNLGLLELLAHMQHHSAKVRREAFHGLKELCETFPTVWQSNLSRIMESTTTAPIDGYAEVREAFLDFQGWLIENVPKSTVISFASTLALHVRTALSHVSSEVRSDGLDLLELYLRELGSERLFSQEEVMHLTSVLCQLSSTSQSDSVLGSLYQLLGFRTLGLREGSESAQISTSSTQESSQDASPPEQVPLQTVLQGKLHLRSDSSTRSQLSSSSNSGGAAVAARPAVEDSEIWACCIRAWLQATELPFGEAGGGGGSGGGGGEGGRPKHQSHPRLRVAAVLERMLEGVVLGGDAGGDSREDDALCPSPGQLSELCSIVRRGEWPARVEQRSRLAPVAEALNLRMARVFALLAMGNVVPESCQPQVLRLAAAAVKFLVEFTRQFADSSSGGGGGSGATLEKLEVYLFPRGLGAAHALGTIGMLWTCGGSALKDSSLPSSLSQKDLEDLLTATACLASGSTLDQGAFDAASDAGSIARLRETPCLLSVPLTASLLGLRPLGLGASPPAALRSVWPQSLGLPADANFSIFIQEAKPGCIEQWVAIWPRLLWYLRADDVSLSRYLLDILLELAKKAAQTGSLYEKLWTSICPYLVPFLCGRPSVDANLPPPLVLLPSHSDGPQGVAARLLSHFPKIGEPLLKLMMETLCRWSELGECGQHRLGDESCELILQALLATGADGKGTSLSLRLSGILSLLSRKPRAAGHAAAAAESAAVRLTSVAADWLMQDSDLSSASVPALPSAASTAVNREQEQQQAAARIRCLSAPLRSMLAFETLAWPLCDKALETAPYAASRVLCFIFFCSLRLPAQEVLSAIKTGSRTQTDMLRKIFERMILCPSACAVHPPEHAPGLDFLKHPALKSVAGEASLSGNIIASTRRRLCRVFLGLARRLLRAEICYELVVKLCAKRLLEDLRHHGGEGGVEAPAKRQKLEGSSGLNSTDNITSEFVPSAFAACASLLQESISVRIEESWSTQGWGEASLAQGLMSFEVVGQDGATIDLLPMQPATLAAELRAAFNSKDLAEFWSTHNSELSVDRDALVSMLSLM